MEINSFPGNTPYVAQPKKVTYEMVSKFVRVNTNICASHIDQIVSKSSTPLTKWSQQSIIFGDAMVHFPNNDFGLFFLPKLLSSVRPRVFFLGKIQYKK